MTSRGGRRGSSQRNLSRGSHGSIRRTSSSRRQRDPSTNLRRSRRLELLAARESDSPDDTTSRSGRNERESPIWSTDSVAETEPTSSNPRGPPPQDSGPSQRGTSTRAYNRVDNQTRPVSPWMNGVIDDSINNPYAMNILIEPPNQIRPGHLLNPPLVLRLDQPSSDHPQRSPPEDPTLLWAVVSLFCADTARPIAPPQADLLLGTPVDSVHPLTSEIPGRELGFVSFPNLAIREPGRYRLQVSLIRMNAVGTSTAAPLFEGGTNMQHTFTRVIHVDPAAEAPTLGK